MDKDSAIFEENKERDDNSIETITRELLFTNSHSRIYREKRDGKFFIIKKSALKGERGRKILRREYELSIKAEHPNIIHVYEFRRKENGDDEIVMEYIAGRNLYAYIQENPSKSDRKRIVSELLEAVEFLHSIRIIHNDLKPENIIISNNGNRLKIIDLGLSDDDANYLIKTPGCSPLFAAPELNYLRHSDEKSDIYSIGKLMELILNNKKTGIIRRCLQENPSKRFPDIRSIKRSIRLKRKISRAVLLFSPIMILCATTISATVYFNNKTVTGTANLREVVRGQADSLNKQNETIYGIREAVQKQNEELVITKKNFIALEDQYGKVNSNIQEALKEDDLHQQTITEAMENFRKVMKDILIPIKEAMIDCPPDSDSSDIRSYYKTLASQLYNQYPKIIDNEDISPSLHKIYLEELVNADKELEELESSRQ